MDRYLTMVASVFCIGGWAFYIALRDMFYLIVAIIATTFIGLQLLRAWAGVYDEDQSR